MHEIAQENIESQPNEEIPRKVKNDVISKTKKLIPKLKL